MGLIIIVVTLYKADGTTASTDIKTGEKLIARRKVVEIEDIFIPYPR